VLANGTLDYGIDFLMLFELLAEELLAVVDYRIL